jgi:hypothetical protein
MTSTDALATMSGNSAAQHLLRSSNLARLAYTWKDGTPRVVPMWFHWTGESVLMGVPPNAPKTGVLIDRPDVAITIDSNDWPYQMLSIRGVASVEIVEGLFPEYREMARRYLGDAGSEQFLALADQIFSRWVRITLHPREARILDFAAGQFPSAWSMPATPA